jgi:hypothetical protein
MHQSPLRLPDSDPVPASTPALPPRERRSRVRQKLHSPVYASFNSPHTGMVVDLSELLDLHEEGFAVQTAETLEVNRPMDLTLDLPETRKFIHGSGQVMWSDPSGRGGIRLAALPESSQQVLKEWLFANLLIACSNHAARTEQLAAQQVATEEIPPEPLPAAEPSGPAPVLDLGYLLTAVDAVRREVNDSGADRDAVFQFIIAHALRLTGADGVALAFLTDGDMICRARAGEPAPPLGATVDRKHGLSGECIRSATIVSCEDTENDARVDREICRALGIGSMLAAPVFSGLRVVGLLEVFSPHPRSFTKAHEMVLERLVEALPDERPETPLQQDAATGAVLPAPSARDSSQQAVSETRSEPEPKTETQAQAPRVRVPLSLVYIGLMVLLAGIMAVAAGYFVARHWYGSVAQATTQPGAPTVAAQNVSGRAIDKDSAEALRKLADAGDADAQWRMGVRYHTGAGVPQDDRQAVQWFLRAAEQGHISAQATLGAYYSAGRGVPQDFSRAYFWSRLALAQGDDTSKPRLEHLAALMTPPQITAASQQADNWIRQHSSTKQAKN